ncbi:hypothetical protein AA12717_3745 [Gluconacetobacter sacchari DSM 12717]|uniref:Uncharacterized protein n=1 Tax=Gluconacetobacter sacchari DSM 12717 TaxID=1307940 RepID=A0ABQ0PD65_9PROT|nr:hypothetical protein AA12717_3745 [Gluconacetobacter sacchari DSM 12717]
MKRDGKLGAGRRGTRAAITAAYRARRIAAGWVDFRRYVPGEIRGEIGKSVSRKIRRWQLKQNKPNDNDKTDGE